MRVLPALLTLGLMSSSALAADLLEPVVPVEPVPVVEEVPVFTWTGFYAGVDLGYAFGGEGGGGGDNICAEIDDDFDGDRRRCFYGDSDNVDELEGWFAGVDLGWLYQTGAFVWGIEGDLKWADVDTGDNDGYGNYGRNNFDFDHGLALDWFGTARLSAGVAFDRALIYATGGFAFGGLEANLGCNRLFDEAREQFRCNGGNIIEDDTEVGWTLGAGAKYAVTDNVSIGAEYKYVSFEDVIDGSVETRVDRRRFDDVDFDRRRVRIDDNGGNDVDLDFHTVTLKVDFLFGPGGLFQ
jgi:outer membrane immunogenic protein